MKKGYEFCYQITHEMRMGIGSVKVQLFNIKDMDEAETKAKELVRKSFPQGTMVFLCKKGELLIQEDI